MEVLNGNKSKINQNQCTYHEQQHITKFCTIKFTTKMCYKKALI